MLLACHASQDKLCNQPLDVFTLEYVVQYAVKNSESERLTFKRSRSLVSRALNVSIISCRVCFRPGILTPSVARAAMLIMLWKAGCSSAWIGYKGWVRINVRNNFLNIPGLLRPTIQWQPGENPNPNKERHVLLLGVHINVDRGSFGLPPLLWRQLSYVLYLPVTWIQNAPTPPMKDNRPVGHQLVGLVSIKSGHKYLMICLKMASQRSCFRYNQNFFFVLFSKEK